MVRPSLFTGAAVAFGAIGTIILGVVPGPLLNLAQHAAASLFVR